MSDRIRELVEREFGDPGEIAFSRVSVKLFAQRCVRAALREACGQIAMMSCGCVLRVTEHFSLTEDDS